LSLNNKEGGEEEREREREEAGRGGSFVVE